MSAKSAPQVALLCCTWREGGVAVLRPADASRRPAWPLAPLAGAAEPDAIADALARRLLGRAPLWIAQVGAITEGDMLAIAYVALLPAGSEPPQGFRWTMVPKGGGTPLMRAAIAYLRDRLDREPVAFRLLPTTFTLTELQQVYEVLLERRLHKASFRRTLLAAHLVEPTEAWRSEGRGRPAQLFRFSPRRRRGVQRAVRFELLG
jgi:hypothetical protein